VSDIPIGTPPSPPGRHAAPGGWYPDPIDATQERYWDGWQWSRTTRPRATSAPVGQPPVAGPPYGQPQLGQPQFGQPYQGQPPQSYGPSQPAAFRAAALGGGAQAAYTEDGVALSGWWWRVLAALLDGLFVSIIVIIPAFPIYRRMIGALSAYFEQVVQAAQSGSAPPTQPDMTTIFSPTDQLVLVAIQIGVALLYQILFLRWKSATPGKLICGLRVVPVDHGRATDPLAWNSVVVRALVWVIPGATAYLLVVRVLDGLFPLWHPKRQALHDLAAKTQVTRPV
jgi:uncharacterized RDD family membrane protein YckC